MTREFIGGWTLSNFGGVGVLEMDGESMLVQYYDNEPEEVEIQEEYQEDAEEVEELVEYPRTEIEDAQTRMYLD